MVKYYSETYRRKVEWEKRGRIPVNYSIARAILDLMLDLGEQMSLVGMSYKSFNRWAMGYPQPPRWRYNRAIKFLEQTGKIKNVKKGDSIFIELTKKGKIQALLDRLRMGMAEAKKKRWDGKWRLIIWDIPESSRLQRNRIRKFVKKMGFYRLQHSVFIIPHELPRAAVAYLHETGLINYIRFLRVDVLDYAKDLLKYFGIRN